MTMPSDATGPLPDPILHHFHAVMQVPGDWNESDSALDAVSLRPRLGVFGGTFDPIHVGHLLLAQEAAFRLQLHGVYFLPAGCPPHKPGQPITPIEHRLAMAQIATQDNPIFHVGHVDAAADRPSFTVRLMEHIQNRLRHPAEINFLMGMDSLRDLHTWHEPETLLRQCRLIALARPSVEISWSSLERRFPGIRNRVTVLEMPEMDVSGINVRDRLKSHRPIRYLVPPQVIQYIDAHGLYA